MSPSRQCRQRLLTAAVPLLATPVLFATDYNLSNQSVNVATAPYTAADTLNLSNVTFTSPTANVTLRPTLNILSAAFANNAANVTYAGALSGTGSFQKLGFASLTLTAPAPSFTGPFTLSAGSLRLTDPAALGPANAPTPLTLSSTLDVSGSLPLRPVLLSGGVLSNNTTTPVALDAALTISSAPSFSLAGSGNLTFSSPLPSAGSLSKSGNGTATYSTPTSFSTGITVSFGTLRLGIDAPFAGSSSLSISHSGLLDLNGFNSPGVPITLNTDGGAVVNDNTTATSTISTLPTSPLFNHIGFGGAGNINITAPLPSSGTFSYGGTGVLLLSSANPTSNTTIEVGTGTIRLNNPSATNSTSTTFTLFINGSLDLNGYPAPPGLYRFADGFVVNNNLSTPSTLGPVADTFIDIAGKPKFSGAGEIIATDTLPASFGKLGPGTLTLARPAGVTANFTITGGSVRLAYTTSLLPGSVASLYAGGRLDLNGSPLPAGVTVRFYDGAIVNDNPLNPVTLNPFTYSIEPNSDGQTYNPAFGGDGTLNLNFGNLPPSMTLNKVGTGLLTLAGDFSPAALKLRAGTLQVESPAQLGSNVSFLGGSLRIAPFALAPQPSYTLTANLAVDPATGGSIDTQRDATFTGLLSGAGPLTKLGTGSLALNPSPSSRLSLSIQSGLLKLLPTTPSPTTLSSLTLSPGATFDLAAHTVVINTGADSLLTYRDLLASHQLFSSSTNATHVLGYALTLDPTPHVTLSLTSPGDANLDGRIDPDDYTVLDRSLARAATDATWQSGDFNYDGAVNDLDYQLIDQSFIRQGGPLSPDFLAQRESQFGPAYVAELLASVPEPVAATYLVAALLPISIKRRRSH